MNQVFASPQVTLYQGDCLEVMPTLEAKSFDAIICDLPYGTTACPWDTVIPFEPLWQEYRRLIKPNGAIVLFGSQPFTSVLVTSNLEWFRYSTVWKKNVASNFLDANTKPLKIHEDICVFYQTRPTYNPQRTKGSAYVQKRSGFDDSGECYGNVKTRTQTINEGWRHPTSVVEFERQVGLHPTQKPIALLQYLIQTYTNPSDRILDNCAGSGTTLVAARDTGRIAVGIEQDEKYCAIAADRCRQQTIFELQLQGA